MLIEKNWVEALATMPFYLAAIFTLNGFIKLEALGYVITILILLFVFGALYRLLVVRRVRNGTNSWWALVHWYLGQIIILSGAWYISVIAISAST
jgi:hypothetical protein